MASRVVPELCCAADTAPQSSQLFTSEALSDRADDQAEQKLVGLKPDEKKPEALEDFDPSGGSGNPPEGLFNKLIQGYALLYPELPWGSPPSWKKSGQTQTLLVIWEMTTGMGCLWVAISLPYAMFIDGAKHHDYQVIAQQLESAPGHPTFTPGTVPHGTLLILCPSSFPSSWAAVRSKSGGCGRRQLPRFGQEWTCYVIVCS
jgi:hypothetical protein